MSKYRMSIRADEGRPDLWPSTVAGSADQVAPVVTDEELADWSAPYVVTDGRKTDPRWARLEGERWHGVTLLRDGRGQTLTGETMDLERAADAWLSNAEYPIDRPDRIAESVDMSTFLPFWETQGKADRVAWRGAAHYKPITHNRGNVREHPTTRGDRTRSLTWKRATGRKNREAVDVTRVDPIAIAWCDHYRASLPWHITWQNVAPAKRKASVPRTEHRLEQARAKRTARRNAELAAQTAAETIRLANVKATAPQARMAETPESSQMSRPIPDPFLGVNGERMSPDPIHVVNDAPTSVYGRVVTAWTASPRSLPRILARADESVRQNALAWSEILATTTVASIVLTNGNEVSVTGALVDDSEHGPMTARVWAQRAAIAGVMPD